MTSVKEIHVDREPREGELGAGTFYFTDDYSVFDWGQMPDRIPEKGAALCTMGAANFELLDVNHIPTHYRGVYETSDSGEGEPKELGECASPPRTMAIELARVPDLPTDGEAYDYEAFHAAAGDGYVVPLEIVFRNTVPEGSSLRRRRSPAEFDLPYETWPDEVVDLPEPIVEFSTKFEEQDRYLSRTEAEAIAGQASLDRLEELALGVNTVVTMRAEQTGFTHEDGKIEVVYDDGTLKVADVVGTFDENRFSYQGQELSKEVVRQYYRRTDPDWVDAVSAAKAEAREQGVADWRSLCEESPDPLPAEVIEVVSDVYTAGTNTYTDFDWFDAPALDEVVEAVEEL
ncbi:phosphoribosylaminoimidazolesuccinocarboxamide synthase [Salinigranum halophilum]|jgi:phosphoribosylaminoimidazole-succinocarboxamide synthase|uniref:phosphoribosylaminoimidazolesuccinocarboxamide synthase n=1 Tax=Salinigranum halophilum TaxID=2565931 RepID=UPI00115D34E8|nr:phosphoribosylaminoimidazolesuccinocarboxamide synthase [Salinigranum halophilum]